MLSPAFIAGFVSMAIGYVLLRYLLHVLYVLDASLGVLDYTFMYYCCTLLRTSMIRMCPTFCNTFYTSYGLLVQADHLIYGCQPPWVLFFVNNRDFF